MAKSDDGPSLSKLGSATRDITNYLKALQGKVIPKSGELYSASLNDSEVWFNPMEDAGQPVDINRLSWGEK